MIPIFDITNINTERDLVAAYIARKAIYKKYPSQYLEQISSLVEKMYNIYQFEPNKELLSHPLVSEAYEFAFKSHAGQERKYIKTAYINHPVELANYISSIPGATHHEVVAGLLHDVIEDCGITRKQVVTQFGETVDQHVHYLTDHAPLNAGNREQRSHINFDYFKQSSNATKNIKMIDILSNTRSIVLCDARFSLTFIPRLKEMKDYFHAIKDSISPMLLKHLDETISVADEVIALQKKFNIIKLDSKSSKHIASINPKNNSQDYGEEIEESAEKKPKKKRI
jgi:guanosine-3',5'-bis(diphosphate) 3'-pyrophosphohydrolase